jgi:MinD-like ATPase involved in chromosome partitioning or flagellar assembly
MKLLILDVSTEGQAFCAKRLESFSENDREMLDLQVHLVSEKNLDEKLEQTDVLVMGSGLGEKAQTIARQALTKVPWLHIVMFVTDQAYHGGAFRAAHSVGVRKVFPDSASPLDFLQELVSIHAEFRRKGRTREGKVIAVVHAKGGVGATSISAAIAEVCSVFQKRTMLWDLDVETRDLSRSLTVNGVEAQVVSAWVNGSKEVSRQTLTDALIPISSEVSVLMPPDRMTESMELVCGVDSMNIVSRVIDLARVAFDAIIIDTGGRIGPATGSLIRLADTVLVVIDDTILGLTAVDLYLSFIKPLVASSDNILFAVNPYSGSIMSIPQLAAELEPAHHLGERPWRLPPIPNDPRAALWPGSGRTLYSMGQKSTRAVLELVASEMGLIDTTKNVQGTNEKKAIDSKSGASSNSWLKKVFSSNRT